MAQNEGDLIEAMGKAFREHHAFSFWRKIHGSQYQAGFPDVLCANADGAALVEFKWCRTDRLLMGAVSNMAMELLTGLQRAELTMLGALDGPLRARVLIGAPVEADELSGGEGELAIGFALGDVADYKTVSALDLASDCLTARARVKTPGAPVLAWPTRPAGLEYQLRARGETWQAARLCLGLKRFQVKTKHDPEVDYS
jgi:hypothetical protein